MTIDKIRSLYLAEPFQPFVIHLADGRQVPVSSREFIMAVPSGRMIVVSQPDDTAAVRQANYEESVGWYAGITADMFT